MAHSSARDISTTIVGVCWMLMAPQSVVWSKEDMRAQLSPVLAGSVFDAWLSEVVWPDAPALMAITNTPVDRILDPIQRRQHGVYFTPPVFAQTMSELMVSRLNTHCDGADGWIVDLSAGQGDLILPLMERMPHHRFAMVELSAPFAVLAAARVVALRRSQCVTMMQDRVWIGDGLDTAWPLEGDPVIAVIGNPPYVGEKHNKVLFDALKNKHPSLAPYFCGRMDLLYLFFHRALDWLMPGGQLLYLTSAYWLHATGAQRLRLDLQQRARVDALVRFPGQSLFEGAPGHESLLLFATGGASTSQSVHALTWEGAVASLTDDHINQSTQTSLGDATKPWRPFHHEDATKWLTRYQSHTTPLGDITRAYQGFVSGMDRVNKQHLNRVSDVELHTPVFLFESWADVPESLRELVGDYVYPLMRGSVVSSDTIYLRAEETPWALYVDRAIDDDHVRGVVRDHLAPFEFVLSQRREVKQGRMPWYRLHWPRKRALMLGPKLVTARRGSRVCFALDLSGSVVSSDCTFIAPPAQSVSPVEDLIRLMLVLNTPEIAEAIRLMGKQKGALMEFYAQPLRDWPVPLVLSPDGIHWDSAWADHPIAVEIEKLVEQTKGDLINATATATVLLRPGAAVHSESIWRDVDSLPLT